MKQIVVNHHNIVFMGVLTSGLTLGCKFGGGDAAGNRGDNDSIVAAIGGISDEDIKKNPNYKLFCKDPSSKNRAPLTGAVQDNTKIVFANASEVKPNDTCSFEVSLPNAADTKYKDWEWFAFKGSEKVVGLMYGSELAKVTSDRKLEVKVLKVYSEPTPGGFKALIKVTLPQDDQSPLSASLTCEGNLSASGTVTNAGETGANRTVEISLSDKFFNKKCSDLSLLAGSVAKYSIKGMGDVDFAGAKAKDTLEFPKNFKTDGKRYTLGVQSVGDLVPEFKDGGSCKNFDAVKNVCLDATTSSTNSSSNKTNQNIIARLVVDEAGKPNVVYVSGPGKGGLGVLPAGSALDIKDFAQGATAGNPSYNFYSAFDFVTTLGKKEFSNAMRDGSEQILKDKKLKPENVKNLKFVKIERYWVHGFHALGDRMDLDKTVNPIWFGILTLKKEGQSHQVLVTGPIDGFQSKDKVTDQWVYFDWATLVKQAQAKALNNWRVYALSQSGLKSQAANPTECEKKKLSLNGMMDTIGVMTKEDLPGVSSYIADCRLKADKVTPFDGGWEVTSAQFYHWTWYDGK